MEVQIQAIEAILKDILPQYDGAPIPNNLDLTDLLDSISFVKMIIRLEQEYNILISIQDFLIERFNTILKIKETIERYQNKNP